MNLFVQYITHTWEFSCGNDGVTCGLWVSEHGYAFLCVHVGYFHAVFHMKV